MDRIRDFIASLEARGVDSPYLQRLRQRAEQKSGGRGGAGLDALRREILGEMAASLGRAEDRVNVALLNLDVLDREIEALAAEKDRDARAHARWVEKLVAFNAECDVAEKRVWELTVQREAIGLRTHELLERFYPIPPRKRLP
jgi:hypothetical protein